MEDRWLHIVRAPGRRFLIWIKDVPNVRVDRMMALPGELRGTRGAYAMMRLAMVSRLQQAQVKAWRGLVAQLTPHERIVFALFVRGKLNRHIADELGVAKRTVKAWRKKVMEKTKAKTVAELVLMAERLGMT